jgi:hypothetical protein
MLFVLFACAQPDEAPVEFSDAARYGLEHFDDEAADALAPPLLALEEQIYATLDMTSAVSADRALELEVLTGVEVEGIPHPGRDPAAAVPPVALARDSVFPLADHVSIAMRDDLSPMEPNSPNLYARTLTEGGECWVDRGCLFLRTDNDVLKENALMQVGYPLKKDYRWVDLGDDRWAVAARSWMPESATGEDGGTTLWQSFTFEVFIPRDGDVTLRMMALWAETELSIDPGEDVVATTQLVGIDDIFKAHDEWLTDNP